MVHARTGGSRRGIPPPTTAILSLDFCGFAGGLRGHFRLWLRIIPGPPFCPPNARSVSWVHEPLSNIGNGREGSHSWRSGALNRTTVLRRPRLRFFPGGRITGRSLRTEIGTVSCRAKRSQASSYVRDGCRKDAGAEAMPRREKGPRLHLKPAHGTRHSVWIIKDGQKRISTGCSPDDAEGASEPPSCTI